MDRYNLTNPLFYEKACLYQRSKMTTFEINKIEKISSFVEYSDVNLLFLVHNLT